MSTRCSSGTQGGNCSYPLQQLHTAVISCSALDVHFAKLLGPLAGHTCRMLALLSLMDLTHCLLSYTHKSWPCQNNGRLHCHVASECFTGATAKHAVPQHAGCEPVV